MANTQNYINHLLQNTGITPACSEEERLAAEDIAQIFRNHGFDPEVQEFNAPAPSRLAFAVTGILAFAGALLMGIGGGIGLVGTLLAIVGAVLYVLERTGHPVVSRLGKTGVSQNVIAYHKASGPLASPRNRPVVVVAHYDSPRAELLAREPYAPCRALIAKLLPVATIAPAAVAILRILPLPGVLKVLLWVVAILASLVALANAANIISNRFVLPYTSGAVCNKSSVAAMLGVMDNVAPYQGENEFPDDIPFDTYFGEQKRRAEEMARAAAEYAAAQQQNDYGNTIEYEEPSYDEDEFGQPVAPVDAPEQDETFDGQIDGFEGASADETLIGVIAPEAQDQTAQAEVSTEEKSSAEPAEEPAVVEAAEPKPKLYRNAAGNIRFGSDAIRALGMLPESCTLDYEEGEEPAFEPEPAPVAQEPAPAANTAGGAISGDNAAPLLPPSRSLPLLLPRSLTQSPHSILQPVWIFWHLPLRHRLKTRPPTKTMTSTRNACPMRVTPISRPRFPRQRPMPISLPRSPRLVPALLASLRVPLRRARSSSTTLRKSAPLPARPPSGRPSPNSRPPRPSVSVRHRSSSRARPSSWSLPMSPMLRRLLRLRSRHPLTLPRLRRPLMRSSRSIAPCHLMPR